MRNPRWTAPLFCAALGCGGTGTDEAVDAPGPDDTSTPDGSFADTRGDVDATMDADTTLDATVDDGNCMPFDRPSDAVLAASKKKVFSHYFSPFPLSLDDK